MTIKFEIGEYLLPGLPIERIRACYSVAPGNEIDSGKFASKESSAALAANTFGFFLDRASELPSLPGTDDLGWPASSVELEAVVRFPWSGGKHPCLDVLIETPTSLIGVESKRYEPFRTKGPAALSDAYDRDVWGTEMSGYQRVRDALRDGTLTFRHLDATQLVKHAFGLRTAVHKQPQYAGKKPILFYLFAEPKHWSDLRLIPSADIDRHGAEIQQFAELVQGNEVSFRSCSYSQLIEPWKTCAFEAIHEHARAVRSRFPETTS